MKKILINVFSIILFITGVALAVGLLVITIWGDLEASMFDASMRYEEGVQGLKCPVLITSGERSKVSAVFSNPHIRPVDRRVRVHISSGYATLMREIDARLQLEPGATEKLSWDILPEDAAFGNIIMVRVSSHRSNPLPSQSSSCGIYVLDVPTMSGQQVFTSASIASCVFLLLGAGVFTLSHRPLKGKPQKLARGMFFMIVVLAIGILISLFGSWMLGALLLVVAVFMIFILPVSAMFR